MLSLSQKAHTSKSKKELIEELERAEALLEAYTTGGEAPPDPAGNSPDFHRNLMESVLDAMPNPVWVKDREDRYLFVNKALAENYGRKPGDFLGKCAAEVGHLDEKQLSWFADMDRKVMESGQVEEEPERRIEVPGGGHTIRYTLKIPMRDETGQTVAVLGLSEDITQRKRAEAELSRSQQLMAGVLDIADDAIVSINEQHIITMYNKGAERTFGYSAEEAIGQNLDILLPGSVQKNHKRHIEDFSKSSHVARNMSERAEIYGLHKNGTKFSAEASISKLELDGANTYTVILRDITQRKLVEESLRSSRRLLQTVFNTIPHSIVVRDTSSHYLMVNDAASDFLGLPSEQILNKKIQDIPNRRPQDIAEEFEADTEALASGESTHAQVKRQHSDGREVELQTIRSPLRDDDGKIVGLVMVGVDITDRVQAEHRAKESHERLMDAVESISQGFVLYDPQDKLVLWNEKFAEINADIKDLLVPGTTFETLVRAAANCGRVTRMLSDPEEWFRERMRYHKNPIGSVEHRGSDGGWYIATERRTREGGTAGVWTEFTERKLVEDALRAREEQLQLFINHAPVAVAMFDKDMRYIVHSRRWLEDFDLEGPDLVGRSQLEVFPETPNHWEEAFQRCLAGEVQKCDEECIQRADGTNWWLRWEFHPWRNSGGEINGIVAFIEVINARKETEAKLIRSQRMEAIGQLTGGVAHEFNNLLHIIQSYAFLLGKTLPDSPKTQALLKPIEKASNRGRDLVKRLLAFSRRQLLQPKVIDLSEVTLDLIELIRPPLGDTIELTTLTSNDLWPVLADQGELENALLNLALNARDAMPNGGKLTITTENYVASGTSTEEGAEPAREYVRLAVADTGQGIAPELREQVFEPFFTTKGLAQHSGLGLSMVHGFVNQSGGYMHIESELDQGTTISLYLPRVSA